MTLSFTYLFTLCGIPLNATQLAVILDFNKEFENKSISSVIPLLPKNKEQKRICKSQVTVFLTMFQIREGSLVQILGKLASWPEKGNGKLKKIWREPFLLTPQNSSLTPLL